MAEAVKGRTARARIRLELDEKGKLGIAVQNLPPASAQPWTYAVSDLRVQSCDALARHKTSWRKHLDDEFARLHTKTGCDQVLFLNERGEIGLALKVSDEVQPGVVLVPGQRPSAEAISGTINMLCSDRYTDMGEGATYQSTWLEVGPWPATRAA